MGVNVTLPIISMDIPVCAKIVGVFFIERMNIFILRVKMNDLTKHADFKYIRQGNTVYLTIPLNHVSEFTQRTGCMDEITKLPYPEDSKEELKDD